MQDSPGFRYSSKGLGLVTVLWPSSLAASALQASTTHALVLQFLHGPSSVPSCLFCCTNLCSSRRRPRIQRRCIHHASSAMLSSVFETFYGRAILHLRLAQTKTNRLSWALQSPCSLWSLSTFSGFFPIYQFRQRRGK